MAIVSLSEMIAKKAVEIVTFGCGHALLNGWRPSPVPTVGAGQRALLRLASSSSKMTRRVMQTEHLAAEIKIEQE